MGAIMYSVFSFILHIQVIFQSFVIDTGYVAQASFELLNLLFSFLSVWLQVCATMTTFWGLFLKFSFQNAINYHYHQLSLIHLPKIINFVLPLTMSKSEIFICFCTWETVSINADINFST